VSALVRLLGLGVRARTVVVGTDAVRAAVRAGECRCVVRAADVSPRVEEKVLRLAAARAVPVVAGPPAAALGEALGRPPVMVLGVCDPQLARGILRQDGPGA